MDMDANEVVQRMKDFGLKGVRDGSAHLFIKPDLLAEFVQSEILAEREACAKVCEDLVSALDGGGNTYRRPAHAEHCAAKIRARSNASVSRPRAAAEETPTPAPRSA
jgi:hypothetical protein